MKPKQSPDSSFDTKQYYGLDQLKQSLGTGLIQRVKLKKPKIIVPKLTLNLK